MSLQIRSIRLIWFQVTKIDNDGNVRMQPYKFPKEERNGLTEIVVTKEQIERIREDT